MSEARVRAWVLLRSKNPAATAEEIASRFPDGGEDWVIIRADLVEGKHHLVVPVDAANDAAFQTVLAFLAGTAGVQEIDVERVVSHYPAPTHRAHSFVTANEVEAWRVPEFEKPGRHPKSPGANPWG